MAIKRAVKRSATADSVTLFEAFEDFMQEKEAQSLSKSTLHNYRQSFDFLCKFAKYDDKTITEYVDQQGIYIMINTLKNNGVQPSSINHYLRDVRTFLYWCMDGTRAYITPSFKVKEIEGMAFSCCTLLEYAFYPKSITTNAGSTFEYCTNFA